MKAYKHRSPTRLVMATAHIPFEKYRLKCVDPVQMQTVVERILAAILSIFSEWSIFRRCDHPYWALPLISFPIISHTLQ